MPGTETFKWKEIFLGLCVLGVVFVVFILQTLFAVPITPVEPLVVETEHEAGLSNETDEVRDLPTIANGVVQRGEPHDKLIELLSNSDSEIRIAAANALAEAIRGTMAGWDTHQQFWKRSVFYGHCCRLWYIPIMNGMDCGSCSSVRVFMSRC